MDFYHGKRGVYAVAIQLDFMSFRIGVLFPHFGFEVFYLSHNMYTDRLHSGYRVFKEGMSDWKPVIQVAVYEEWVVESQP